MIFFTVEISDPAFESDNIRLLTVKSANLKGRGDISLFIPKGYETAENLPVCILLHGVYGSHWAWTRKAGVHLTAQQLIDDGKIKPMILAMPSDGLFADGSGYLPHSSVNYEKWIADDIPNVLIQYIEQISDNSLFFLTGLSMGGYGALRIGAKNSERFAAFSGHSSITAFEQLQDFYEPGTFSQLKNQVELEENVLEIVKKYKENLSPFRFDCGTNDDLFSANKILHDQLKKAGISHDFEQFEGGHSWDYWKVHVEKSLTFFSDKI